MTGGYLGEIYLGQYNYDQTETVPSTLETDRSSWFSKVIQRATWASPDPSDPA